MDEEYKIYTKTGDRGETSLIGGDRVPKNHPRIEAYGDVDELNSWIGLLRDQDMDILHKKVLLEVQRRLFTIESHLAAPDIKTRQVLPMLQSNWIERLEKEIDRMNEGLSDLQNFIIPGGCIEASYAHLGRTVCRRVERRVITLDAVDNVDPLILKYLNRLSDYLFILARTLTLYHKGTESPWITNI